MEQYINKNAVLAQANIEITGCHIAAQQGILTEFGKGKLEGLEGIVDFINTLKVKEVGNNTDAFIEKAADYIAKNMRCNGYTLQTKAKFIRDFKKYMKGE